MGRASLSYVCTAFALACLTGPQFVLAQDRGVRGSSALGDSLRAQGRFLLWKTKLETAILPLDDQRARSRSYVKRLDQATKIFVEQGFAEQLIKDVTEHKATTIAELLAFMRQYRLLFSDPGDSPEIVRSFSSLKEGAHRAGRESARAG